MSAFLNAGLANGYSVNGPSLVYGVNLPPDIQSMFDDLEFIGNSDKDFNIVVNWGMQGSGGDIMESFRLFYDYAYNYLSGKTTIDQFLVSHKANINQYLDQAMTSSRISRNDLNNPQNAPTGQ
jgi:hypothetical protein